MHQLVLHLPAVDGDPETHGVKMLPSDSQPVGAASHLVPLTVRSIFLLKAQQTLSEETLQILQV